jgi:hypothetical protein
MAETRDVLDVSALLGGIGIAAAALQDSVILEVEESLRRWSLNADIVGIRWGCVTLAADHVTAAKLQWQREELVRRVSEVSEGTVKDVRIWVTRSAERNNHE